MVNMRGWLPGPRPLYLTVTVILCFFAGLLAAGPLKLSNSSSSLSIPLATPFHNDAVVPKYSAMVCASDKGKEIAIMCQQFGWYCNPNGVLIDSRPNHPICEKLCKCVNIASVPGYCLLNQVRKVCKVAMNGTILDDSGDIIGNASEAKVLSDGTLDLDPPALVERHNSLALVKRHNYALVCVDKDWTFICKDVGGYSCSGNGKLTYTKYTLWCATECQCISIAPRPKFCLLNQVQKVCTVSVDNDVVFDANGDIIGNVSAAQVLPNGTLDFGPSALVTRHSYDLSALTKRHNYALVCTDEEFTWMCKAVGYGCNSIGTLTYKEKWEGCRDECECVNLSPAPKLCLLNQVKKACTVSVDNEMVFDTSGDIIGNVSSAQVLPDATLDFDSPALAKRNTTDIALNNWIMSCYHDVVWLQECNLAGFYCTIAGKLAVYPPTVRNYFCAAICSCVYLPLDALTTTLVEKQETILAEQDDLASTPALVEKRENILAKRHDFALVCDTKSGTSLCSKKPFEYYCNGNGKLKRQGTAIAFCSNFCECINLKPKPKCIIAPYVVVGCNIGDGIAYQDNGQVIGNLSQAYVLANGTLDFTQVAPEDSNESRKRVKTTVPPIPTVTLSSIVPPSLESNTLTFESKLRSADPTKRSENNDSAGNGRFDLQCLTGGHYNQSLTDRCKSEQYICLRIPLNPLAMLHHTGPGDPECEANCECPNSFHEEIIERSEVADEVSSTENLDPASMACFSHGKINDSLTSYCSDHGYACLPLVGGTFLSTLINNGPEDISDCDHDCQCPQPLPSRSIRALHLELSATTDKIPHTLSQAPPGGVSRQPPSNYGLNCGNRIDGISFCSSDELGYFCTSNMTVARNTTIQNQAVTWCDNYCSCIFNGPVPCLNKWNIPLCREFPDGTVRDASQLQIVLAWVDDVIILPNTTILLDGAQDGFFPFVAAESGFLHGDNGTTNSTDLPDWNGNGTMWNETSK